MPVEVLKKSYRSSGQALGEYINREFYQGRIIFEPTASSYIGASNVLLEKISAGPSSQPESSDQELAKTMELIFQHAQLKPEDSLLVATASAKHADRLQSELRLALQARPDLNPFFEGHGREKFEVTTIADLAHRISDRIIFSVGFGKDANGLAPKSLGQISNPEARRFLANLLVSARKQITVVSALEPADLAEDKGPGIKVFRELLEAIAKVRTPKFEAEIDPMISDLAMRLTKLGVSTRTNFSSRFKLIASVQSRVAVIEPDWGLLGYNLSERHRLRPMLLRSMGWDYIRVPSFELFADPEATANAIASKLGIELDKKPQPLFEIAPKAFEDTAMAWGDLVESNDQRLIEDKPPHWG
jgi:hypothetical protein